MKDTLSSSQLRDQTAATLDRVLAGAAFTVTRNQRPVALLLPPSWLRRCGRCGTAWCASVDSGCVACGAPASEVIRGA